MRVLLKELINPKKTLRSIFDHCSKDSSEGNTAIGAIHLGKHDKEFTVCTGACIQCSHTTSPCSLQQTLSAPQLECEQYHLEHDMQLIVTRDPSGQLPLPIAHWRSFGSTFGITFCTGGLTTIKFALIEFKYSLHISSAYGFPVLISSTNGAKMRICAGERSNAVFIC
jgi:hypothetical protein